MLTISSSPSTYLLSHFIFSYQSLQSQFHAAHLSFTTQSYTIIVSPDISLTISFRNTVSVGKQGHSIIIVLSDHEWVQKEQEDYIEDFRAIIKGHKTVVEGPYMIRIDIENDERREECLYALAVRLSESSSYEEKKGLQDMLEQAHILQQEKESIDSDEDDDDQQDGQDHQPEPNKNHHFSN